MSEEPAMPHLTIVPCSYERAAAYVARVHRHHDPPQQNVTCVAVIDDTGLVRGVAMFGRPVARMIDDGFTAEVRRVATDGCPNACSALYGACARIAKGYGYRRIVTYVLQEETGVSIRASGWRESPRASGSVHWNRPNVGRLRRDERIYPQKNRWERTLADHDLAVRWPEAEPTGQATLFEEAAS